MKNIQRIMKYYLAVFFLASPAYLQAQTPYTSGDIDIDAPADVPSNVAAITRIDGDLDIGGTITVFPNFAALKIVEGDLSIRGITTNTLTDLTNIFPVLDSVRGDLTIVSEHIQAISGFAELDSVGGDLDVVSNTLLATVSGFDGLSIIAGTLSIGLFGGRNDALTSFPSFSALTSIGVGLRIENNDALTTISGFDALETIGQFLLIGLNGRLTTVSGFAALQNIEDDLDITNNAQLTTLPTFDALKDIGRSLDISDNAQLTTLPTFAALKNVDSNFIIRNNEALTAVSDFAALQTIGFKFSIDNNAVLATVSGFEVLKSVGSPAPGDFIIEDNPLLETVSGFSALQTIGADFNISNNDLLTALPAFSALTSVDEDFSIIDNALLATLPTFSLLTRIGGDFTIQNNTSLSSCCDLRRFVDGRVEPSGSTTISSNDEKCNSVSEIIDNCVAESLLGLPTLANDIRFYPNPTSQTLYIEGISEETSLIIRAPSGKTLLRTSLRQNQAINLADLPQGTYLLTLQNAQEQSTRRLVIAGTLAKRALDGIKSILGRMEVGKVYLSVRHAINLIFTGFFSQRKDYPTPILALKITITHEKYSKNYEVLLGGSFPRKSRLSASANHLYERKPLHHSRYRRAEQRLRNYAYYRFPLHRQDSFFP